jgi:hypothetical protein
MVILFGNNLPNSCNVPVRLFNTSIEIAKQKYAAWVPFLHPFVLIKTA